MNIIEEQDDERFSCPVPLKVKSEITLAYSNERFSKSLALVNRNF